MVVLVGDNCRVALPFSCKFEREKRLVTWTHWLCCFSSYMYFISALIKKLSTKMPYVALYGAFHSCMYWVHVSNRV